MLGNKDPHLNGIKEDHFIMPLGSVGQEFGQGRVEMVESLSWEDINSLGLGPSGGFSTQHLGRGYLKAGFSCVGSTCMWLGLLPARQLGSEQVRLERKHSERIG